MGVAVCSPIDLRLKKGYAEECGRCAERDRCSEFFTSGRPRRSRAIPSPLSRTPSRVAVAHAGPRDVKSGGWSLIAAPLRVGRKWDDANRATFIEKTAKRKR